MAEKALNSYTVMIVPDQGKQYARIAMVCADGHQLYVEFKDWAGSPPANYWNANGMYGFASQPFRMYTHYLDLLRNEKPLKVNFLINRTPPEFIVGTNVEPVGEEES